MTGSAGFTGIHVRHGYRLSVGTGRDNLGMAIATVVATPHMYLVAEVNVIDIFLVGEIVLYGLLHRMAFDAIPFYTEGILTVVTGSTGQAFLHLNHGIALVKLNRLERFRVTVIAAVERCVEFVTENRARIMETDLLYRVTP